jgi:hypothetical protein
MATFEELDKLSSKELHDRAVHRARRHLDEKFYRRLLSTLPAGEVAAGQEEHEQYDVDSAESLVFDAFAADDGKLADGLRPLYIEYLLEHGD